MRILVVEDDQLLNKTLSYNLSAVGYSVDGAMSKAVAIRFLEKQDYDLIVLDVNLPDGNGFDICREVKERRPDTAVIFLTANDMESDMLKGFELGADDYVTKPFPISVFQKKVSAIRSRMIIKRKPLHEPEVQNSPIWHFPTWDAIDAAVYSSLFLCFCVSFCSTL